VTNGWTCLSELSVTQLNANLAALSDTQPSLIPVIEQQKCRDDILLKSFDNGFYLCKYIVDGKEFHLHHETNVISHASQFCQSILRSFDQGAWLVLAHGAGLGYAIHQASIQLETKRRGEPKGIICLENNAAILCAAFSLFDFTIPISTGRLLWAVGGNYQDQLCALCQDHHLETLDKNQIHVLSALKSEIDSDAKKELEIVLQQFWCKHQSLRDLYFQKLKQAGEYWANPVSEISRVWTHFNTDRGGAEMLLGLIEGFHESGLATRAPMMSDRLFTRFYRVAADFFDFHPDLILSQNHSSDYMASFAQQVPIPRAVWYVDDPANMANIPYNQHDRIFSVSDSFAGEIKDRGGLYACILHSAAPSTLSPPLKNDWRFQASYVGSVHDNRKILDNIPSDIRGRLECAILAMQKNHLNADIHKDSSQILDAGQVDQLAGMVAALIPKSRYMNAEQTVKYFIYMEANTRRRIEAISLLDDIEGLAIYGQPAWKELLPSQKLRNSYCGFIDSRRDLLELYHTSKINLCFNSLQGFGFINLRLFDVPYAGGFILAEWVTLLPDIFAEESECVWFTSHNEMKNKITHYLDDDEARLEIIHKAQSLILEKHTYKHRAQTLLNALDSQAENQ
jgi:glycosyl transferase family 1